MTYDVLVKQTNGHFTATVLGLPDCTVEAATRSEAIQQAQVAATNFIAEGEVVTIQINAPGAQKSIKDFAGMWAEDDTFDEFIAAIESHRREVDADSKQP